MGFNKKITKYILKNKDIPVATFEYEKYKELEEPFKGFIKYNFKNIQILNKDLLPTTFPTSGNTSELKKWIEKRRIPKNRQNMLDILNYELESLDLKSNNLMNYIDISYGLSLNDSYWIVPDDGKEYLWKDYNLYQNKFNSILPFIALGKKVETKNTNEIKISPEYTTEGMIAKCWTIIDGKIYLLKKSTEWNGKEVYSEYYMGQIAEIMEFEHIKYDIIDYYGDMVSCCQLFTDENIGFIPMEDCLERNDKFKTDISLFKVVSQIYPREKLADLMLFDSLIYNTDRHLRNFGMLIDNNTKKILRPAPIFDNGNSIITLINENSNIDKLFNRYISKVEIDFNYLAKHFVCERHREGLEKLRVFSFKRHLKYNLPDNILKKVEQFIHRRAEISLKYLNEKI